VVRPRSKPAGVTPDTRAVVLARADGRCERCGKFPDTYSLHHRRPRGMGGVSGDRAEVTNSPANLIVLCGSATSAGDCHPWVESNRLAANELGLLLFQHQDPRTEPVTLHVGRVLLTDDGRYEQVEAA
jgi:5-methylcytosine-specific restriction enzyme A